MPKRRNLPLVAICGRPNVGKSTLFNRIVGRQRAIVHDDEGITRDRAYDKAEHAGREFRVVDTGGVVEEPTDPITHKIQEQVWAALREARVIVFVVDGQQEITRVDEEVRDQLFKLGKPVVLAVNKLDNERLELNRADFYALGMGEPIAISSGHGLGMEELLNAVCEHLPPSSEVAEGEDEEPADITKVAVIGKPNVGKSSFINAILNEERTIVTDIPGTTRDAIDIDFHWRGKDYLLIDTAGMRKKAQIFKDVERFSVSRSLRTIRRADVCLVMMDGTEGISEQDKRIVNYVSENGSGMVLVWTKWDLVEDKDARFKALASEMDLKAPFLRYVPSVTISNLTRQRLFAIFDYIDRVKEQVEKRVSTADLNRLVEQFRENETPAIHKGGHAKILYATQASVKPTTFVLFVNQKRLFHFSYMRFVENRIREKFGFEGVPIQLELREEKKRAKPPRAGEPER